MPDDPNRFLVHDEKRDGPATHAIVIGVGDYPHLLGGTKTLSEFNDGMGQLTSPPLSARNMAHWLIEEFHNPDAPLATVALLLSEPANAQFENPINKKQSMVERAEMQYVDPAIQQWKERGETDKRNLLLFFFCGHGVAQGPDTSLLLSDYGANADNPLKGAIYFSKMRLGMKRCLAERQLYFVDACRSSSDTRREALDIGGEVIILPKGNGLKNIKAPVFYSTLAGAKAYGRTNKPSVYTDLLIKGLKGGGAHDNNGDWRVSTTRLKEAVDGYMARAVAAEEINNQVPPTDDLTTFDFHFLKDKRPNADVFVQCTPETANGSAAFGYTPLEAGISPKVDREAPSAKPWDLQLIYGKYSFSASFVDGAFNSKDEDVLVRPPFREIFIDVA